MKFNVLEELSINNIVCLDDFLSVGKCNHILKELAYSYWQNSTVVEKNQENQYVDTISSCRISQTTNQNWFSDELNIIIQELENKIYEVFSIDPKRCESWQGTKYAVNGKFDYHVDAGYWITTPEGERVRTILLYLNTPIKGGNTHFRALNKEFEAKAGRLLVWNNTFKNGNCNYGMIHSGTPLLKGIKTTLVTWERQRDYRI